MTETTNNQPARGYTLLQPATRWQDAIPLGNGPIGALVYGDIASELIALNHDSLWLKTPTPEMPDIAFGLPEVRRLLADSQWAEAETYMSKLAIERGYDAKIDPYHPAGDLAIETICDGAAKSYRRSLDFATGECVVSWTDAGNACRRRTFVSRAHNVVIVEIASAQPIKRIRLNLQGHGLVEATGFGSGKDVEPVKPPVTFIAAADGNCMTLVGEYDSGGTFGMAARVTAPGAKMSIDSDGIVLTGCTEALIVIGLIPSDANIEALANDSARIDRLAVTATAGNYDTLFAEHAALHRPLFERSDVQIGERDAVQLPLEAQWLESYTGDVPTSMIATLADYGKYLLISSSAPGSLPANLQGVWNGDWAPAWSSDFHNDENIQMNYWAALPQALDDTTLPYFDYYDASIPDYRENATRVFGCRGIVVPVAQSTHGKLFPGLWMNWTVGAGWLAQLYFDYWLFTGDRKFLADRAVPFLRECALFFEDFCQVGGDGYVHFSPSLSPENAPSGKPANLTTVDSTMDVAIAREVLTNLSTACYELGIEPKVSWSELLAKLPPYQINEDGAFREWLDPRLLDNYEHRHQSHVYPLFPGFEILPETDPVLYESIRIAIEKRLVVGLTAQTGWSFAHMANVYARLADGDRALECLELLCRACVGPNLLAYHNDWRAQGLSMYWGPGSQPPYQIDANFGLTAAVIEMLLFSSTDFLKLLPALPGKWPTGSATGLRTRQGLTVSISWDKPAQRFEATFEASRDANFTLKLPDWAAAAVVAGSEPSDYGPAYRTVNIRAGEKLAIG